MVIFQNNVSAISSTINNFIVSFYCECIHMNCVSILACQSLPTNLPFAFLHVFFGFHFKKIVGFCNLDLKANM